MGAEEVKLSTGADGCILGLDGLELIAGVLLSPDRTSALSESTEVEVIFSGGREEISRRSPFDRNIGEITARVSSTEYLNPGRDFGSVLEFSFGMEIVERWGAAP